MSLIDWEKKYYKSVEGAKDWTDKKCAEHTLKKYRGVKKVKDYDLILEDSELHLKGTDHFFVFGSHTCSFCEKYYKENNKKPCRNCPLHKEKNNCDIDNSAYDLFTKENDPNPMIKLMKTIISKCDTEGKYVK